MKNAFRFVAFTVASAIAATGIALPQAARFVTYTYQADKQYEVTCVSRLECSIQLLPGEKVTSAFDSDANSWEPHVGYSGLDSATPSIIVRPQRSGLEANVVVNTTARTYYLDYHSCGSGSCSLTYYHFAAPEEPKAPTDHVAYAPGIVITPAPMLADVDLSRVCNQDHFAVDPTPIEWRPTQVCTDGQHTYVQLPTYADARSGVPVLHAVNDDGKDELVNATYDARTSRYIVDGIYPTLVLLGGTPNRPWRLKMQHTDSHAFAPPQPTPTPILAPGVNPLNHRVFVTPPPIGVAGVPSAIVPNALAAPVPIYDQHGAVLAYTTADLSANPQFTSVLNGGGNVSGYVMTPNQQAQVAQTSINLVPKNGCPQPSATGLADTHWDSATQWSRDLRYATQGADSIVAYDAIKHGALSRGVFGFVRSPIGFIIGQGIEDLIVDHATKNACPRVINATNTGLALSALVNAIRSRSNP